MSVAHIKRLSEFFSLPALAILLAGCGAEALVLLPLKLAIEGIAYAIEDDGPEATDGSRIIGYCRHPSKDIAYPLYRSTNATKCAPNDHAISKAEFDEIVAQRARAYCAKKITEALYRSSSRTCADGDETLSKSGYEARLQFHFRRAAV